MQPQDQIRDGRRIHVVVMLRILVLVDDRADRRHHRPHQEHDDWEEHVAQDVEQFVDERPPGARRRAHAFAVFGCANRTTTMLARYSASSGRASSAIVMGLPSGAAMPAAMKMPSAAWRHLSASMRAFTIPTLARIASTIGNWNMTAKMPSRIVMNPMVGSS